MARWACVLGVLGAAVLLRADPPGGFDVVAKPFLEEYCVSCHAGERAKGDLDLARADPGDAALWATVRVRLGRRDMPPEDADRPSDEEYRRITAWLDARRAVDDPGRVTIRRLNRAEYENTVRDLLGVHFDARATFPADDVGYGFDNIGDVLSLPPVLMEKYLTAAERIAALAVVDDRAGPAVRRFEGDDLRLAGAGRATGQGALLYAPGEIFVELTLPRDGVYVLRARAFGDQAGPEPARLTFRVDGRNLATVDVPAVRGAPETYEHRMRLKRGRHRIGFGFYNDYYRPNHPDPKERDRNLGVAWAEVEGPTDAPVYPSSHRRLVPKDPPETGWEPLLEETVARLAERAWRRPVATDEVERVLAAAAKAAPEGASFAGRLRLAVTALLVSPHFLFRVETDPGPGVRDLTDWELASRLSYFLWASMPDDELFALARKGELRGRLADEAARMLKDPRAGTLAHGFAAQWLQIRRVDGIEPDPTRFPEVDGVLKEAMRRETELFFEAILREDRSVWELLDADFTFVNGPLAKLYGIPGVEGPFLRRVAVDGTQRGGVLGQAAVLLSTSNPTRTSPVKRGKWILESLLDAPLPPPPPGADQFDESQEALASASLRERLERHRKDPQCAGCHLVMDTLGFGLENYDAVGRWRERNGRFAVDSSGELPDGRTFFGPPGLKRVLRGDRRFLRSLAKHMLVYALGRGATAADEPALDRLADLLEKDPRLSRLVRAIVTLDAFTKRRGEERTK